MAGLCMCIFKCLRSIVMITMIFVTCQLLFFCLWNEMNSVCGVCSNKKIKPYAI